MAAVRPELLQRPVQETARVLALAWMDEADAALERLSDPDDTEALHDFRVALRRFRSCVRAYQPYLKGSSPKKARKQIQKLASATNVGRDSEVQIEWLTSQADKLQPRERKGLRWLLDTLEARRDTAYDEAQQTIAREFRTLKRNIAKRLSSYKLKVALDEPGSRRSFVAVTGELLDEHADALQDHLGHVHSPADEDEAHQARIEAKKLRYLIEPLAKSVDGVKTLVKDLKKLQDILGELHDTHVLMGEIAAATEEAAAEQARRLHELALQDDGATPPRRRSAASPYTPGLLTLTRRLVERRDRRFAALRKGWLEGKAAGFLGRVGELSRRMQRAGDADLEIERKYILTGLPDSLNGKPSMLIDQGWLPGTKIQERLRRTRSAEGIRYYRTVKSGSGLVRSQVEERISKKTFEDLWPLTERKRIRKRRYKVADGNLTWEIDRFLDRELVLAEVELPTAETEVSIPAWLEPFLVREVTTNVKYQNVNLARRAK